MNNVALAMKEAQRWDDAERYAARACELAPDDASYRFNLAIIQLVRGNVAAGWRGHEARWDGAGELRGRRPVLPGLRWQGEPLAGKTLLVWASRGSATLQFCRFVAPLAERVHREGGRLVWNTFPLVGTLMQRSLGPHADAFSAGGGIESLPAFDYEVPLIGLPLMLGMEASTLASSVPYLRADPHARDAWRARLAGDRRLKVGNRVDGQRGAPAQSVPAGGARALCRRVPRDRRRRVLFAAAGRERGCRGGARGGLRDRGRHGGTDELRRYGCVHRRAGSGDHRVHVGRTPGGCSARAPGCCST